MQELHKEKTKWTRIIWITVLSVCLLIIAGISAYFIHGYRQKRQYTKYLEEANAYYSASQYDKAIVAYRSALKIDESQEEPYTGLSNAYIQETNYSMARVILERGYEHTHSQDMLETLQAIENAEDGVSYDSLQSDLSGEESAWNTDLIENLGKYNYGQYNDQYQSANVKDTGSQYEVALTELRAKAYYDKSGNGNSGIGSPPEEEVPSYLVFEDLSVVFPDWENDLNPITVEQIVGEKPDIQEADGIHWLVFYYLDCEFHIACDPYGKVESQTAQNRVVPLAKPKETEKGTLQGTVMNAVTEDMVDEVDISGLNSADSPVATTVSGNDGDFSLELPPGEYTLSFAKSGYVTKTMDVTVTAGGSEDLGVIALSPTLGEGEWRVVMSWGDEPKDLDLHLKSSNMYVCYDRPSDSGSNGESAVLDVDQQNGNGIETITIKNMQPDETYQFFVKDFSNRDDPDDTMLSASGVTVEVYSPDGEITSFTVPEGTGTVWEVCTITNGEIAEIGTIGNQGGLD